MNGNAGIVWGGLRSLLRNKRYVVWFYLLNLLLAWMGAMALKMGISQVLDTSVYSDRLLHGFDVFVFIGLVTRPELAGHAVARPHLYFTYVFLFLSILFMPGVLDGFGSDRRLSREDFWATCGRNLWRFVRLFLFDLVIAGITFGILVAINGALGKAADSSSNEKLPFYVQLIGAIIIFLIMTWIRIWFDLAEASVVINDEGRVRKAIRVAAGYARRSFARLLGSYVLISILALGVLVLGLWLWDVIVPPASVLGAFVIGQVILFLWLASRFWQRACAVAFCVTNMKEDRAEERFTPVSAPVPPSPLEPGAEPA
jgi:hypothetical protein